MRRVDGRAIFVVLLGAAVAGFCVYRFQVRPTAQGLAFYKSAPSIPGRICRNDDKSSLCAALRFKSIDRLGMHNDLWVAFDALHLLLESKTTDTEVLAIYNSLNTSLSEEGILAYIVSDLNLEPAEGVHRDLVVSSNALYFAVVAHIGRCEALINAPPCKNGVPLALRASLHQMLAFLDLNLTKRLPYEATNRAPSVAAIREARTFD